MPGLPPPRNLTRAAKPGLFWLWCRCDGRRAAVHVRWPLKCKCARLRCLADRRYFIQTDTTRRIDDEVVRLSAASHLSVRRR